jgi:hypothetical protein
MEVQVWSDVQVNVQSAKATALTVSAISKANPAVVSYTGTDPVDGDIMLIRCVGLADADYLVARAASVDGTANTFALEGIDSTNWNGTFSSGTASKLTLGTAASTLTDVNPSGGEAEDINVRTIHNSRDRVIPGNFSPLIHNFGSLWDPQDPALVALRAFGKQKTAIGVEFVFATGVKVLGCAIPSASLAPGGSAGGTVTTPVKVAWQGDLSFYAS